ncbi:MAG: hypothetical protein NVSMB57_12980 [Actinomycetota bacterium]
MGSVNRRGVIRRILVCGALAATMVPGGASAATTSLAPPYKAGPQGGDANNYFSSDPSTGDMTVVRLAFQGPSGGLGCGGSAGFSNFAVDTTAPEALKTVTVHYKMAVTDPYTWINVGVLQDGHYVNSEVRRGILAAEDGAVTVDVKGAHAGPLTIWFGLQVSSACPNADGGRATFSSVALNS